MPFKHRGSQFWRTKRKFDDDVLSDTDSGPWEWQRVALAEVATWLGRSALGPDGAPYKAGRLGEPEVSEVIDEIAAELAVGSESLSKFEGVANLIAVAVAQG